MRFFWLLVYMVRFTWAVVVANFQVARLLFVSNSKLSPALIRVPITLKSDGAILCLTSMITLTPGTLSIEVNESKTEIVVHVIHTESPEESVKEIQEGFEKWVLRVWGAKP